MGEIRIVGPGEHADIILWYARKTFLHKPVCCYVLLEPSHRDGCNNGVTDIYFINK